MVNSQRFYLFVPYCFPTLAAAHIASDKHTPTANNDADRIAKPSRDFSHTDGINFTNSCFVCRQSIAVDNSSSVFSADSKVLYVSSMFLITV